jgi:enterochelin esterase-like enzyme
MDTKQPKRTSPIIDGDSVLFEWYGSNPPKLIGDFNNWNGSHGVAFTSAGSGRWQARLKLPKDAYIEYAYLVDGKRLLDPNNPQHVHNGMEHVNNYFYMPGKQPTSLVRYGRGVPRGTVKRYKVEARYALGDGDRGISLFERTVYLYQPPVVEPSPLLVVFDGPDYLKRAKLPAIVDNLIHQKRIRPIAMAMLAHGRRNRFIEYACSDVTLGFLMFNVLPLARKELKLVDPKQAPGAFGVLGASMGGLIALYTGLRQPEVFGHIISQSGAFYPKFVVSDLVSNRQANQIKIWMDVGSMEYLVDYNRQMHRLLVEHDYNVHYQEYAGGHNYTSWRDEVVSGLLDQFVV